MSQPRERSNWMNPHIGLHEQYALVSPQVFRDRMDKHWTETLGMCSSNALRSLWTIMAQTFRTSAINNIIGVQSPWKILQPPTGSGKTQGSCLYAAMQAILNSADDRKPVGILVLTRRIEQANTIVADINKFAGRVVAVASHSKSDTTQAQVNQCDVLVITHQAYVNASSAMNTGGASGWERLIAWRGGQRHLTIIDEALANVVEDNKVNFDNLNQVLGYIPLDVEAACPEQVAALKEMRETLSELARCIGGSHTARIVWPDGTCGAAHVSMGPLREAMRHIRYDRLIGEDSAQKRQTMARHADAVIADAEALMAQWAYYAKKGKEHSLNTSRFLIPWNLPGPVVLDATASSNFLWDLFESRADIVLTPGHTRDYSNVTLHVARASGVGKGTMREKIKTRFPRLLETLERDLSKDKSVFVCMHKATEHVALSYEGSHEFARLAVGHWGAIDGRNDWSDYDTAVIFGLPYRDQIWANNLFFAMQGPQDDAWLQSPEWKQYGDVRRVMEQRQLSVSIIQAINRVRCRKVIDKEGRSLPADIYVVLPKDKTGDAILQDIAADMPYLNVVPWDFAMDGPKVRKARIGTSHAALVTLMDHRLPGEAPMSFIQRELGVKPGGLKKLKEVLRDKTHATTKALQAIGVQYVVRGAGRGAKSYLVKEQAA